MFDLLSEQHFFTYSNFWVRPLTAAMLNFMKDQNDYALKRSLSSFDGDKITD